MNQWLHQQVSEWMCEFFPRFFSSFWSLALVAFCLFSCVCCCFLFVVSWSHKNTLKLVRYRRCSARCNRIRTMCMPICNIMFCVCFFFKSKILGQNDNQNSMARSIAAQDDSYKSIGDVEEEEPIRNHTNDTKKNWLNGHITIEIITFRQQNDMIKFIVKWTSGGEASKNENQLKYIYRLIRMS